jgi:Ca2+-binding EF-hand superfamily protein
MSITKLLQMEMLSHRLRSESIPRTRARQSEEQLRSAFALFDVDESGYFPVSELPLLMRAVGVDADPNNISFEGERKGFVNLTEFRRAVDELCVPQNTDEEAQLVWDLVDKDGVGSLSLEDLRQASQSTAAGNFSDDELGEILRYCDVDGDGVVSREDWMTVMHFVNEMEK